MLSQQKFGWVLLSFVIVASTFCLDAAIGQDDPDLAVEASEIQSVINDPGEVEPPPVEEPSGIDLLSLMVQGGSFMIPIGFMSLLVVSLATERLLTLRTKKVLPPTLVNELEAMAENYDTFSPTTAYEICGESSSPAARVISAMLLRTGQPLSDIERTATETTQREADIYAGPIRWLNLAAAATPLMGLLGTVWGMIIAFHESTTLTAERNRGEQLAEGIYIALVTTLAGLVVAIPAAILAQYFENRLLRLFHQIEELAFDIAPGLARFVGRLRLDPSGTMRPMERIDAAPPLPPPMAVEPATTTARS